MIDTVPNCVIETVDLSMTYRTDRVEVPALRNVNLSVYEGEFVAIMGPSGCGKSTLLHLLGGLLKPTAGKVSIDGVDIARLNDSERTEVRRNKIGFVFQRFNLLPSISARANIELAKRIHGNGSISRNGFDQLVEMLGLREKLNFRPTALSGGEQQRVAIARAVINNPAIVLADEPTGSLDSKNSRIVLRMLQDLNERMKQTIIMITHDPDAASIASRTIEIRDGQVLDRSQQSVSYEPEFEGIL
jgi:putative ABC transport system ATP-binding protein